MSKDNLIQDKSYRFALRVARMYQYLIREGRDYTLAKQVLRSGTSIGANVEEALAAHSKKDFAAKMTVALKEARETVYWLRLLRDSQWLEEKYADDILHDAIELRKILTAIVKTSKNNS